MSTEKPIIKSATVELTFANGVTTRYFIDDRDCPIGFELSSETDVVDQTADDATAVSVRPGPRRKVRVHLVGRGPNIGEVSPLHRTMAEVHRLALSAEGAIANPITKLGEWHARGVRAACKYILAAFEDRVGGDDEIDEPVRPPAAAPAVPAVEAPAVEAEDHPERRCQRCGRLNVSSWSAPSPLWNQVMRGGDINGEDRFDGIVCPVCFAALAEEAGIAKRWRFYAQEVLVPLPTTTPSGRVWNEQTWLWDEPSRPPAVEGSGTDE